MQRAGLRAISILALATLGCGPGDHAHSAGLGQLFGGGAAGKGQAGRAADTDDTDDTDDSAAAPPNSAQLGVPTAGRAANGGGRSTPEPGVAGNVSPRGSSAGEPSAPPTSETTGTAPPTKPPATADPDAGLSCMPGYVAIAAQCVCDLNGTFTLHGRIPVALAGQAPLEALNDTIDLWGIVRTSYDADGNLSISLSTCGQTAPDICAAAQAPVLPTPEAYAQYVPVEVWDKSEPISLQIALPAALPGAPFNTPPLTQLSGVKLANPLGPWPATRKDVQGTMDFDGSATNGAQWVDSDGDGQLGITIKIVSPGGISAGDGSGPPRSYAATSAKCPRSDPRAARSAYAYLPLPQGLGVKRIKAFHSAQRMNFEFHGALESCDRLSGMLTGANGNKLRADALIGGCTVVNGSGEAACAASLLDSANSGGGGGTALELGVGSFVLSRAGTDVSCTQVRASAD